MEMNKIRVHLFQFSKRYTRNVILRKKGTDHPKVPVAWVTILVFEHFWVVSPFFTPVSLFIRYPGRQLQKDMKGLSHE